MGWTASLSSSSVLARIQCACFFLIFLSFRISNAQNATTDPSEVEALTSIFRQWRIASVGLWNLSGEPCSGSAINGTEFEDPANNPAIKCDCTYNSSTICHITSLRAYALDVRGVIPEAMSSLTYLTFLKIDQNYFTGPLPFFITNLKALSLLSLAVNNFEGTLPPELGNLVKLEELYIISSGLGGEIPSTFANLTSLKTVWASDNNFIGKIPDFIGNWTSLEALRFQGNSFEGPIPSSFSKLVSLISLRINDLSNASSTLDFIKNMKSLTDLNLRNASITDTIPSDIGDLRSLAILDLSFNNLTGQIPSSLFNISNLEYLFLGNNSLSGALPSQKSSKLQTIDLSYNFLSGSFPSWVSSNLQLNLVANNYIFDSSNISVFPGLNCLQRNFPCKRNPSRYARFAINSGGAQVTGAGGIVYEAETASLSTASINVSRSEKWAVSNVGLYYERASPVYIENNLFQFSYTDTPELFQTARTSPGSLRYYGLGLKNGKYTINLLFAETAYDDRSLQTWKSLGRRVFDIYIQGSSRMTDFDISREAGGVNRAITRTFKATVSDNHLEIHLYWAGKGTCCIPVQGYYGPTISALSVIPVLLGIGPRPNTFSYAELRTATEDFSTSNRLGEGGYGTVYKGTLSDGREVAVKQLSVASNHGTSQFITEIVTISVVQHRNLVKLYGCCIEGNRRLLVYEYLENKSLDKALFGKGGLQLNWSNRFNICLGTARGLAYLHEESNPRIVHRDVKASNILLDAQLQPKISDFGLAKLYDDEKTHMSTRVAGTFGYLAPEYAMRGHLTEKADVFSFGIVALEILSGRRNSSNSLDNEKIYILEWAWTLHEQNQGLVMVDPLLTDFNEKEALRVIGVALLCTQASPAMRPAMSRVVAMLAGDMEVNAVTTKPGYLSGWDFEDVTSGTFSSENRDNPELHPFQSPLSHAELTLVDHMVVPPKLHTTL